MTPVDPIELSGWLDRELDSERAAAVAEALDADPALAAEFETLQRGDLAWRAAAATAHFRPELRLDPSERRWDRLIGTAVVPALVVALHGIAKVPDAVGVALLLQLLALALMLPWIRHIVEQA